MSEQILKEIQSLREALGKNVDAIARVDQIEAAMKQGGEDLKGVRAELAAIKTTVEERDKLIRSLQEETRTRALAADPLKQRERSLEMLGMICRSEMARFARQELPAQFRTEAEQVKRYQEECLARATLTPMSTTGSYLVPTITELSIRDAVEEVSELLSLVDFMPGLPAGGTFNFTFLATRPVMQPKRASTDTAMTASDPVFSQLQVSPNETYVFFPVDNKLFLMSAIGLGGYFERLCRDAMIDKLAYWTLRADATATYNSITGALAETTAAYVYTLPAGKTAFADVTALDLAKAKAKVFKRGRGPRGRWLMDLEILGVLEELDRTGKPPVIRERDDGTFTCKQNPIVIEEYMPGLDESAAATGFALFGDLATILVAMVGGMRIASDASVKFDKNQTAFRGDVIVDIKRKPVQTLVLLKTATA